MPNKQGGDPSPRTKTVIVTIVSGPISLAATAWLDLAHLRWGRRPAGNQRHERGGTKASRQTPGWEDHRSNGEVCNPRRRVGR